MRDLLGQKRDEASPMRTQISTANLAANPSVKGHHDGRQDLAKLLPLWPRELTDASLAGRLRLLAALRRALRCERQRGLGGHWAYDLARHHQLLNAYRCEAEAVRQLSAKSPLHSAAAHGCRI